MKEESNFPDNFVKNQSIETKKIYHNLSQHRIVVGDNGGKLTVWDAEYGILLAELVLHKSSITGIKSLIVDATKQNLVFVSSIDKILSVWNIDTYELAKTTKFSSNAAKLFLSFNFQHSNELILVAGLDLKIYDYNLDLVDEYFRKTNENSIKHIIELDNDRFVVASNSDIELYCIVVEKLSVSSYEEQKSAPMYDQKFEKKVKLKADNREKNAHKDSILSLSKVSDSSFVSSSSDGVLIIWNSIDLKKLVVLKPSDEIQKREALSLTKASCVKPLTEVNSAEIPNNYFMKLKFNDVFKAIHVSIKRI